MTLPTSSANFSGRSLTNMCVLSGKRTALNGAETCSLYQSASLGEKSEPGSERDRDLYGEVVWVVCSEAEAYSVGQVVTYIFHSVQPPEAEGEPIRIIASVVYME